MIAQDEMSNYEDFRDCVSELLISRLSGTCSNTATKRKKATKGRKNEIKPVIRGPDEEKMENESLAADLGETIEYLASEIFPSLPSDLRTLSYPATQNDPLLAEKYTLPLDTTIYTHMLQPLPLSIPDSLLSYGMLSDPTDLPNLLLPLFTCYISSRTTALPEFAPSASTKATECEICEREHLPLTYHHLIPRAVHAKVLKRGWHASWELNRVAWLCRACHSFVHNRVAGNEELARDWYSVELLLQREDVRKWAAWVGKVRWKAR